MTLDAYARRRDFAKTPEPSARGDTVRGDGRGSKRPGFVIQKHDASTLHYDFRLEVGDRLVSWAVPKGPSTDPREKRLAIPTEDHPLDYADFEGVIPAGEYGAGTVIVWDRGAYENRSERDGEALSLEEALDHGYVAVWLEGEKLRGGYALQGMGRGEDAQWLLVKLDDDAADARRNPLSTQPDSVLSGRSIEAVAEAADHD